MSLFRKFIFIILLGFLSLPLIQSSFHFIKLTRLSGAYTLCDDTAFTYEGWFSGKYQAHKERYLRDTFGLRNLFIRARNQADFSLLKKPNAGDIIIGKKGYMYNDWYLKSFNGSDFLGTDSIDKIMVKLKKVNDRLVQMHKTLLIVIAPAKDYYAPEFVPDRYARTDSDNYSASLKLMKEYGFNYIDFNKYFMGIRQKLKYPLYSKYGSHWSHYGVCIAGDSIITMLEKLRNIKMPHTEWKNNIAAEEASGDEIELEDELNLLFPLKHEIMGHPTIENPVDSSKKKPAVLIIGDSYYWGLAVHYNFGASFSSYIFCYYYNTIFISGTQKTVDLADFNLKDAINKSDIILILITVPSLRTFTWGFTDAAYNILTKDTLSVAPKRIPE